MARWDHASCDVAVGVYATASGFGAKTTASPDSISRGSVTKSAPNAKWRSKVVPQAQDNAKALSATPTATDCQEPPAHGRPMRMAKVRAQWLLAAAWPKQDTNPIKKSQLPKKRGGSAVCAPQGGFLLVPAVARV
jgi:hypothetical protein